MELWIRKKALRQAAKVAFGTFVVGCGGGVMTTQDASTDDAQTGSDAKTKDDASSADVGTNDALDAMSTSDGALACTSAVDVDASDISAQTFQCCLGVVEQITGDSGNVFVDAGEVTSDPSIDNCCKAIIAAVDSSSATYSDAEPVLSTCCTALGYPEGIACTPWGPPTPPPFEWLAEVA